MKMLKNVKYLSVIALFALPFASCSDDDSKEEEMIGESTYEVRLTDAPGDFTEVNIEIERIEVQNSSNGWVNLDTRAGIYNLLDFSNGIDTTIASGKLPSGRINQIRFVLGNNNSVKVDGQTYALNIPSGSESGLKLLVDQTLLPDITYSILIDFDAAKSIVLTGNNNYKLKPVLKVVAEGQDALIKGQVSPNSVFTALYAVQNNDTLGGAMTDSTGRFMINGLFEGTYDLIVDPVAPYLKDTIPNITLTNGMIYDVGTVTLQQ